MNYKDAELLNGALDQISGSLLQRKMLEEQARERSAQTGLQQERLQVDQDRWNKTAAYQTRMESKADQQNSLLQNRAALQDKQAMLENIFKLNAGGMLDDDALDSVNDFLANDEHFGKSGIQLVKPQQKPDPQAGQNAIAQGYRQANTWRKQAADLRASGAGNYDPDEADRYDSYAENLEKWGNLQASPKQDKPVKIGEKAIDPTNPGAGKTILYGQPGQAQASAAASQPDFVLDPKTRKLVKNPAKVRVPVPAAAAYPGNP